MVYLKFFIPVIHEYKADSWSQSISNFVEEKADAYFSLTRGKKAYIISPITTAGRGKIELRDSNESLFWKTITTALKIASWFTIVVPISVLAVKLTYRFMNNFYPIFPANNKSAIAQPEVLPRGEPNDLPLPNEHEDPGLEEKKQEVVAQAEEVNQVALPLISDEVQQLDSHGSDLVRQVKVNSFLPCPQPEIQEIPQDAKFLPETEPENLGLNNSWIIVDEESPPIEGTIANRNAFYFKLFESRVQEWTNPDLEKITKDIENMLVDELLTTKIPLTPYPLDGDGNKLKEIGKQLWVDCNRTSKITIDGEIIHSQQKGNFLLNSIRSFLYAPPTVEQVRYEVISNMAKRMNGALLNKISAWMHQSLHVKNITELQTGINKAAQEGMMHFISNWGGYEYQISTTGAYIQLEGSLIFVIRDIFPCSNARAFKDCDQYDLNEGVPVGYLKIYKRIYVPKQDLLHYDPEKGLSNLEVEQIVTPLFTSPDEASEALNRTLHRREQRVKNARSAFVSN